MGVRIVGSLTYRIPVMPPPDEGDADIYARMEAIETLKGNAMAAYANNMECIGFLYGLRFLWQGRERVLVESVVPLPSVASAHHVAIDRGEHEVLFHINSRRLLLGWYHSHISFGAVLSETDVNAHRRWFGNALFLAAVYDVGSLDFQVYTLREGAVIKLPILITRNK